MDGEVHIRPDTMNVPADRMTLIRLTAIAVGGFAFATFVPPTGDPSASQLMLVMAVFVGTMLALLISQAAARRQRLIEAVRTELNKLRRAYHLGKNLSAASPRFRGWFTELHGLIYGYLALFGGKDFTEYDAHNAEFRKVSYHIYTVPDIETMKESVLFDELLRTTAMVSEARQHVKETMENRLSAYSWLVVLLMAAGLVLTIALSLNDTTASRLAGGSAVVAVLLAIDLLWELDTMAGESKPLAKRYTDNIGRLELGRRE